MTTSSSTLASLLCVVIDDDLLCALQFLCTFLFLSEIRLHPSILLFTITGQLFHGDLAS
jgi:hypothetical protein